MKPRVYVDFDDVLCETARGMTDLLAREYGRRVAFEQIHSFDLGISFGLDSVALAQFMHRAHAPDVLGAYAPVEGALAGVRQWAAAGYDVVVVTGRPPSSRDVSEAWLARHDVPYGELIFVDKYGRGHAPHPGAGMVSLAELFAMPFCLAVEDAPEMVGLLAARAPWRVAVLARPWNRTLPAAAAASGRVRRCGSWREVAGMLRRTDGRPLMVDA